MIRGCATTSRKDEHGTWITPEVEAGYSELHELGYAHSVETWRDGELQATATMLRDHAVTEVPAIRLGDRWVSGEWGVPAARALSCQRRSAHRSLAPAG